MIKCDNCAGTYPPSQEQPAFTVRVHGLPKGKRRAFHFCGSLCLWQWVAQRLPAGHDTEAFYLTEDGIDALLREVTP